ncbi:MAG: hypothetical protein IKG17_09825 [Mogibacterium sp.]|nr:hypothetical protein [Mogibacterium sp.]
MNDNNTQFSLRDILHYCKNAVDDLNSTSIVAALREQNQNFDKALNLIEKYLPTAENVLDHDKIDLSIKTATIFLVSLWSKLKQGGSVAELTRDDWNDVLGLAAEKAVTIDPQDYSLFVFDLYRQSIAFAIEPMRPNASETVIKRLEEIVSSMKEYSENLKSGSTSEIKFIEENLWLSLEAVFLVMTDRMNHSLIPKERQELAEAVGALIFQKFRYSHYEKELEAIDECLKSQKDLDQRLTQQVNEYIDALNAELDAFDILAEKAFDITDFQAAFRGSIILAKTFEAEEILETQHDIDNYFMS